MKSAVDTAGEEVLSYDKNKVRKKTVEEKYHAKEKFLKALSEDEKFRNMGVSKRAFKKKYLKALGAGSGSKEEAFQHLSNERVEKLMAGIRNKEDWAIEFAGDAGIDPENVGKSEDHDKAVRASLKKALGGNKKDEEFHSSDVREYNAFEEGAEKKRKKDADKRSLKEKFASFKESAGEFAANSWESVKTGGKKALTGIKRTASGAKDLIKRGWAGAKELATSGEARSEAWKSIKTGVSKAGNAIGSGAVRAYEGTKDFLTNADTRKAAWESVKSGAGYAADVIKHSVKSRAHGIRDWYREGVDQMNVHGDTYNEMGLFDRFMWSAKNLPARMTHGLTSNMIASASRMKENEDAEAAVAYLMQKEEKEKSKA